MWKNSWSSTGMKPFWGAPSRAALASGARRCSSKKREDDFPMGVVARDQLVSSCQVDHPRIIHVPFMKPAPTLPCSNTRWWDLGPQQNVVAERHMSASFRLLYAHLSWTWFWTVSCCLISSRKHKKQTGWCPTLDVESFGATSAMYQQSLVSRCELVLGAW